MRCLTLLLLLSPAIWAQQQSPVQWNLSSDTAKAPPGATVVLRLTARIQPGWHVYSLTTPKPEANGPVLATTAKLAESPAIESSVLYQPQPIRKLDPNFNVETEIFSDQVVFWISAHLKPDAPKGEAQLATQGKFRVCNDQQCRPPKPIDAGYSLTIDASAPSPAAFAVPAGYKEMDAAALASSMIAAPPAPASVNSNAGMGAFVAEAFGLGLLAVFTPCVFPMIPITVSFFLNQRGGILQALVFSLGIVVLFCALGFGVTALVGPFGVSQLSANKWVNGFIALVFGAFALSLLGAFEITLPSGLLTKMDHASRRGGYLGTLLMGLTFSLTSFACVGPFVGSLLAGSVQGSPAQPLIGMAGFASGLASPFFFLAAFPSYLKKLPRSGGWLVRVKVVMGFVLLAWMLKYVSNIDQVLQLGWLTRERFLAAWFVLFALPGLYLLGLLRLEGVEPGESLGVGRLLTASAFLVFAFSLLPGMFGAPLGELDGVVPAGGGGLLTRNGPEAGPVWMKNQYREALDLARQRNKLVLVDFTGYVCTNCHWMKANIFPRPEIAAVMKDLVLVELYTDGPDAASEENAKLEDQKFAQSASPYYVLMNADEKVVATFPGTHDDIRQASEFLTFLNSHS